MVRWAVDLSFLSECIPARSLLFRWFRLVHISLYMYVCVRETEVNDVLHHQFVHLGDNDKQVCGDTPMHCSHLIGRLVWRRWFRRAQVSMCCMPQDAATVTGETMLACLLVCVCGFASVAQSNSKCIYI
jgi:hypothetical protein